MTSHRPALLMTAALLLFVPGPAFAVRDQCVAAGSGPRVDAPTYWVSVAAERPSYRRGQAVVILVEVRHAAADGPKAEQVQVDVAISRAGRVVKKLHGQTNAAGTTRLVWRLPPGARVGRLAAEAAASRLLVDSIDCTGGIVYATGRGKADPLTTVTG